MERIRRIKCTFRQRFTHAVESGGNRLIPSAPHTPASRCTETSVDTPRGIVRAFATCFGLARVSKAAAALLNRRVLSLSDPRLLTTQPAALWAELRAPLRAARTTRLCTASHWRAVSGRTQGQ